MQKSDDDKNIFLRHLPGKIASIAEAWAMVRLDKNIHQGHAEITKALDELQAAATAVGFTVLCRNLAALKECLEAIVSDAGTGRTIEKRQFSHLLDVIKKEAFLLRREHFQTQLCREGAELADGGKRSLYFLENRKQENQLANKIERFGYTSSCFAKASDFIEGFSKKRPDAIVMDAQAADVMIKADSDIFDKIRNADIPLILTSNEDNFNYRHNAARVDAVGFMIEPYKEEDIAETFDRYFSLPSKGPYRVLLVEDIQFHIEYISSVLEKVGMQVEAVSNPLEVLEKLEQFNPEIILMDLYMPNCNGIELAKIIRQYPRYLTIPIAYLSVEENIDKQLDALSIGGDDFITKSISEQQLAYAVKNRIVRYRSLCRMLACDGLTGLLNHSKLKESLAQEVARASRQGSVFSYAMIDVDNFKDVNDSYGHAAGDQVLKTLAQLLKGRFRGSDVLGRYGGEEFAVILPNTHKHDAIRILDDLRDDFSLITHVSNNDEFNVTFSCGVASYPEIDTIRALTEAADMALYQAKNSGRNRVCSKPSE